MTVKFTNEFNLYRTAKAQTLQKVSISPVCKYQLTDNSTNFGAKKGLIAI